jgi:hypothetical protein
MMTMTDSSNKTQKQCGLHSQQPGVACLHELPLKQHNMAMFNDNNLQTATFRQGVESLQEA